MAQKYVDSFGTRKALAVDGQSYDIFRLDLLEKAGFKSISKMPVSLKVLLENLLRQEDNHHVDQGDIEALAILHMDAADRAEEFAALVREHFPADKPPIIAAVGPAVGTHAGPGGVGFACIAAG